MEHHSLTYFRNDDGEKSITLDVDAIDENGTEFDIEVQQRIIMAMDYRFTQ